MTVQDRLLVLTAKGAIKAGVKVLPLVPDDLLLGVSRRSIGKVPWPDRQAFLERLLVLGKQALTDATPAVRSKAAIACIMKAMDLINSEGDIEPCVFTHFTLHNIHTHTLRDALASDLLRAIREHVPYCENLLRPCLIIDHPKLLRDLVARFGARPTHPGAEAILGELRDDLDMYAAQYGRLTDEEWYRCDDLRPALRASGQ